MHFRSLHCHGFGCSRSCQCRAPVEPRQSSSHPQPRLGRWCRQRGTDRLFLRGSDVSEVRLVLASHVPHDGTRDLGLHCLTAKLLIWTLFAAEASGLFLSRLHRRAGSALFTPTVGPLFSHPLWGPLFSVLLHSGARQSCWDFSLFSSDRRALHDVFVCPSRPARHSHGTP